MLTQQHFGELFIQVLTPCLFQWMSLVFIFNNLKLKCCAIFKVYLESLMQTIKLVRSGIKFFFPMLPRIGLFMKKASFNLLL